jgi:hypothetical protein
MLLSCFIPGCIEIGDEEQGVQVPGTPSPASPAGDLYLPSPVTTQVPASTETPVGSAIPADPVPAVSGIIPSDRAYVPETSPLLRPNEMPTATFFSASYSQVYTNEGLMVSVERAPFVIEFWTRPYTNNPHFSFVGITVRDPQTGEVIAEDGFGRKYSSEPYKRMIILGSGQFHVTIHGMRTAVDVRLRGGIDAWAAEPYGKMGIPARVYEEAYPEQEYPW